MTSNASNLNAYSVTPLINTVILLDAAFCSIVTTVCLIPALELCSSTTIQHKEILLAALSSFISFIHECHSRSDSQQESVDSY